MQPRGKKFYDNFGNWIKQHLQNCIGGSEVRKDGSRGKKGGFKRDSDLDLQICVEGNRETKESLYPKVIDCLESLGSYKGEDFRVELGGSGNVVNIFPQNGGKVSVALVDCW